MLEVVLPVLLSTPPKHQQAAPTYCAQFGLPYRFYTEEFPLAVLHATVNILNFKGRIKSHLPFAGMIRSSPYSTHFQDKGQIEIV